MRIVLAGFGTEGKASYDYWNRDGNELTIASEADMVGDAPEGVATITGSDAFRKLEEFDLIIRSPGVNPRKLPYGEKVWSATNEFFEVCTAPIIGVTGTKGKGTTSSLIASILDAAGMKVHLLGNIGNPALAELPKITSADIVVFELSSFQLWDVKKSPHVAVVLGIEPDHLDVHDSMQDYIDAKANITLHQTVSDKLVFNEKNTISSGIAARSHAQKAAYPNEKVTAKYAEAMVIPGAHNIENAAAAVAATSDYCNDEQVIRAGLHSFTGLPHRIKFIREVNGVSYYDDSYSSAPAASIAALKSFVAPKILLLGGYEKHADFNDLATFIATDENVKKVILMGQTKMRIAKCLAENGVPESRYEISKTVDFAQIIERASELAGVGDVVLLSPGSASFDMFKNFTDRGEQFISIVNGL